MVETFGTLRGQCPFLWLKLHFGENQGLELKRAAEGLAGGMSWCR